VNSKCAHQVRPPPKADRALRLPLITGSSEAEESSELPASTTASCLRRPRNRMLRTCRTTKSSRPVPLTS